MRAAAFVVAGVLLATPALALPIQDTDSGQLLLNMTWEVGEFGDEIDIQFGVNNQGGGFLRVDEYLGAQTVNLVDGYAILTTNEVKSLLALEKAANFSSIPDRGTPLPDKDEHGNVIVRIGCYELRISELHQRDHGTLHTVQRPVRW
jgi:hypothetical protein